MAVEILPGRLEEAIAHVDALSAIARRLRDGDRETSVADALATRLCRLLWEQEIASLQGAQA